MRNKNISKKKGFIETFVKRSELIQSIIAIMVIIAVLVADYGITLLEFYFWKIDGSLLNKTVLMTVNLFIGFFGLFFIKLGIIENLIPWLVLSIRKLPAIYRYCFIPFTEEEVRNHEFTSAVDYFRYVKEQVWYGKAEPVDDDVYRINNPCILLTVEDTRKMLTVCIKVFGATSVFELQEKDLIMLADDQRLDGLIKFIQNYHSMKDDVTDTSAVIRDDGKVKLYYQEKQREHQLIF